MLKPELLKHMYQLSGVTPEGYENLYQLVAHGPREAGEIPVKHALPELLTRGWATYTAGLDAPYTVTYSGIVECLRFYSKLDNPHFKFFGGLIVGMATYEEDGSLNSSPLNTYGDVFEWFKKNILGTSLKFNERKSGIPYATFKFLHPVTGVEHILEPGDVVIFKENGNHTVHQFNKVKS